ncbi:MAG: LptA/OstA family protein, partial [Candidatus Anammoxibacter sp.]
MKSVSKYIVCLVIACLSVLVTGVSYSQNVVRGDLQKPIVISSSEINSWEAGGKRIFVCLQDVRISRGNMEIIANECVCWFHEDKAFRSDVASIDVYFDGNVSMFNNGKSERHEQMFLRLETTAGIVVETGKEGVTGFEEEQKTDLLTRAKSVKQRAKAGRTGTNQSMDAQVFSVESPSQSITILADEVDSWEEGGKRIVTAIGNVQIRKENFVLNADNVILYFNSKEGEGFKFQENDFDELYAEGNVTLRRKEDVQIAEKIFIDIKKNKGILINAQIQIKPDVVGSFDKDRPREHKYGEMTLETKDEELTAHIRAEEIRLLGEGQYEIKNGEFTTCSFSHPHFKFKSSKIRIIKTGDQSVISLAGNKAYLG